MNTNHTQNNSNLLYLAVQSAIIAMFSFPLASMAEDGDASDFKHPANTIELGLSNVASDSAQFGKYNGLDNGRLYGVGDFNLYGGVAYDGAENTIMWQAKGSNLGTTSREVSAGVSNQGHWSLGLKYDELRHNSADGYQTPYLGEMGGNSFTLPASFAVLPNTTNTNLMTALQKSAFHKVDVYSDRTNTSVTAGYAINPQWSVKLDFNHLNQTGAKLMAMTAAGEKRSFTGFAAPAPTAGNPVGQTVAILPNPTNYTTDTFNVAVNWAGEKAHFNAAYFGSIFQNEYDRVNFTTFAGAKTTQTLSTSPDNQFHQLNLMGGYTLSQKTKLAGGLSYGRSTQNDRFAYDPYMMVTPITQTSADALVITTHADLKLTDQTIKNLTLSAGFKYDERDNRTQSNIYNFIGVDGNLALQDKYPNAPFSNRKTQFEVAGDYRISTNQQVRLAYNRENISRWCNQYAVNASYLAGTNCVVATDSADDKLSLNYKLNPTDSLHLNAGYAISDRLTDSDPLARPPITGFKGNTGYTTTTKFNTLTGGVSGVNAGDHLGFYPAFTASRQQQMLKAGADWQANEKLSLGLNGRYTDDSYDSQYGVQDGKSWSLNLDSSFAYNDKGSISAYITKEHRDRLMTNVQAVTVAAPGTTTWTNTLNDDSTSFGIGTKYNGLLKNKLNLLGDISYSLAKTGYGTMLSLPGTCATTAVFTCGQLPDIRNKLVQLKLAADYKVTTSGKVAIEYLYQRLTSNDYFYNGYQLGNTPNSVLPTNQEFGSYSNNVITATYTHSF